MKIYKYTQRYKRRITRDTLYVLAKGNVLSAESKHIYKYFDYYIG